MKEDKEIYFRTSVLKQSMCFDVATQQSCVVARPGPAAASQVKSTLVSINAETEPPLKLPLPLPIPPP
jgi:hypothetical protein